LQIEILDMTKRFRRLVLVFAGICGFTILSGQAADTVRPEMGKPLQAAQELIKQQKYKEALVRIGETDAIPNKTTYEVSITERMRGIAALGAGQIDVAAKSFDELLASSPSPGPEQLKWIQAVAEGYYRAKDYSKAIAWAQRYQKSGGTEDTVGVLLLQSYYLNGDYANAGHEAQMQLAADEKAGRIPTEAQLQLLGSCYLKQNDNAGYAGVLEKLVAHYPKKEYWADLLAHIQRKPGFSDRLSLDVYRLMLVTDNLSSASDYMEMAQLALQAGYPVEAQKVLARGYANKMLGVGQDAERHKRLNDLADKQAKEDRKTLIDTNGTRTGDALVNNGYDLVINGQAEEGLALMQQGISKGDLKHPDEARLHLGEAYLLAGKANEAARQFKSVQGADGTQDLAELWAIQSKASS
jgi:hypothetical protein